MNPGDYVFFWSGPFSNWYKSDFVVDNIRFNCGEQYMMHAKAVIFDDRESAVKILQETDPRSQKALGRSVKGFDSATWDAVKYGVVKKGLIAKFRQNPKLLELLKYTRGKMLVEASPYDRVWGIGFSSDDAMDNIDSWGENLLGKILTELAVEL